MQKVTLMGRYLKVSKKLSNIFLQCRVPNIGSKCLLTFSDHRKKKETEGKRFSFFFDVKQFFPPISTSWASVLFRKIR